MATPAFPPLVQSEMAFSLPWPVHNGHWVDYDRAFEYRTVDHRLGRIGCRNPLYLVNLDHPRISVCLVCPDFQGLRNSRGLVARQYEVRGSQGALLAGANRQGVVGSCDVGAGRHCGCLQPLGFRGFRCSRHEESASTPDSRNDVGGPRRAIIVVAHGPFGHGNTVQIRCWLGTVTNGVGVDHSVDCRFTLTRTNHVQPPGLNMMYAVTNQFFNLHRYMEESSIFSAVEETFQAIHGYRTAEKMERLRIA